MDISNVEAFDDDLRYQGFFEKDAARFARGEGCWYGRDAVFFACTNGGRKRKGQIWRYVPSPDEGKPEESRNPGRMELFFEAVDNKVVENADNLTIAPWGDIIFCEDQAGRKPTQEQYLIGVTPQGEVYKLGRNALNNSELAGVCFSPDGSTLFVNLYMPGITLAITGPWNNGRHNRLFPTLP